MSFDDDDDDEDGSEDDDEPLSVNASDAAETTWAAYFRADDADDVAVPSKDVDEVMGSEVVGPGILAAFGWL